MVAVKKIFDIKSPAPQNTKNIAKHLSSLLSEGDVILLDGELGAGKTFFARELIQGLDIEENVVSPTFTLVKEYENNFNVYHVDLYRIKPEQFFQLGYMEIIGAEDIFIIEWGSKIIDFLDSYLLINFEILSINSRLLEISAFGKRGKSLARKWQESLF